MVNIEEKEEDWLPPPPKISSKAHKTAEDSTLKELRFEHFTVHRFYFLGKSML